MKLAKSTANTDLIPLWPDDDVWMRPMTRKQQKRIQNVSRLASQSAAAAAKAEEDARDAEDEAEVARYEARAEDHREAASRHGSEMTSILMQELIVDAEGNPPEDDPDDITSTLIVRVWARMEEVHAQMGKRRRRKRTSTSGSDATASTPTSSA